MLRTAREVLAPPAGKLVKLERRLFLKQTLSLGALTLLTGCKPTDAESVDKALRVAGVGDCTIQRVPTQACCSCASGSARQSSRSLSTTSSGTSSVFRRST